MGPSEKEMKEEKMLETIEDMRSEIRELRSMVNVLMEIIVNMETQDDLDMDMESNMMGYDSMLKSGNYCM